jgi:ribonuclease E
VPSGKKKTDDSPSTEKTSDEKSKQKPNSLLKKVAKKLAKKLGKKVTKKVTKKVVAKKTTTKKTVAKKTTTKKVDTKATAEDKTKSVTKKTPSKKASEKKTTEETSEEEKTTSKKTSSRRSSSRRGSSRKSASEKDEPKKASETEAGEKQDEASGSEEGGDKKGRRGQGDKSKSSRNSRSPQRRGRRMSIALAEAATGPAPKDRIMLVNEITNEECRIAMIENGRIDEYFVERASSETVVGNIYKARVTNIEPAIQAAFVDFGLGESGFLHVSDLHPKYFPGSEMIEEVGKKIPRRQRPPIQDALKKGQEILVQVLKQGVGTKGPTVTSYLSIPGRLMVMMPDMDRIGVSRKVADDEQRKAMRAILDTLDLPKNFGFIVRTAGFNATKLELKRDVAYLKRLWDQMDRRIQNTGAPCLLYAESDLLIRTIRDVIDQSVKTIVIDNAAAFERATTFLKVAAGSSIPDMRYYDRSIPILNAFGIEKQIDALHDVNVPLKSGGALVIEQTEALVSIDVNSGRSRSAKDSETNAFETNKEAVDEICRQLRLRDLGGLIVNDLIDMRQASHREEIEKRIMQNLKRDRAKATVLPISEFGLVEMTRQRMRPNSKKANFHPCPTCEGTGEMQRPDTVGRDALRKAATILENELVSRIEMVCSSSIASIIMNDKRAEIAMIEERSGCKIAVRVSETIADNRVDIYAYEKDGADVDVAKIKLPKVPQLEDLPLDTEGDEYAREKGGRKRRRRRRGKTAPADATAMALSGGFEIDESEEDETSQETASSDSSESSEGDESDKNGTGKKRRKRRRGGRGRNRSHEEAEVTPVVVEVDPGPIRVHVLAKELEITSREILDRCESEGGFELKNHMSSLQGDGLAKVRAWFTPEPPPAPEKEDSDSSEDSEAMDSEDGEDKPKKRRRRRRGRRGGRNRSENGEEASPDEGNEQASSGDDENTADKDAPQPVSTTGESATSVTSTEDTDSDDPDAQPKKKRRRRRRGGRGRNRSKDESDTNESRDDTDSENSADKPKAKTPVDRPNRDKPEREERARRDESHGNQRKVEPKPDKTPETPSKSVADPTPPKKKPRTLYGGRMRRTTPGG